MLRVGGVLGLLGLSRLSRGGLNWGFSLHHSQAGLLLLCDLGQVLPVSETQFPLLAWGFF
jgi:hypothetical protein